MKKIVLTLIATIIILLVIFIPKRPSIPPQNPITTNSPTPIAFSTFTANFEIYTNGTKRIFTASRYHNLSDEIYISSTDPGVVHIKKAGLTWSDFFATLPMKLTKDCLTTGTGQKFCSNEKQSLKFFINDQESRDAIDQEIKPSDFLKVIYR